MPATARCSRCSASPTIASKRWVYRQYDHMVQTNTINLPGLGAGVVRIKGTDRALAMSVDGNGRYCYLDPRRGAMLAVAEAARNVACAGARPLGATNCLNFGNPERPAIMWQFAQGGRRHRRGVPRAWRADHRRQRQPLQRDRRPRDLPDAGHRRRRAARARGSRARRGGSGNRATSIVLLGEGRGELGGSEYLKTRARPGARRAAGARSRRRARAAGAARRAGRRRA